MTKDITLNFEHNFPLCTCPHCDHKYIILAIWGYNEGDDSFDYMPQVNTNDGGIYCPYCGENSKKIEDKDITMSTETLEAILEGNKKFEEINNV